MFLFFFFFAVPYAGFASCFRHLGTWGALFQHLHPYSSCPFPCFCFTFFFFLFFLQVVSLVCSGWVCGR